MSPYFLIVLLLLPLLLAACTATGETGPEREVHRFQVKRDVVFTPGGWPKALKADIYLPESTAQRPAVIVVHGGSWRTYDKRWFMKSIAQSLARRGYVAMNVTYRGAPKWHYPAPVLDLREAVKWLRRHAKEYHIRPDRIGVYGYSAGGQLAAQVGLLDGPPAVRVQAVVAGGTPSDLRRYPGGRLVPAYLGGTLAREPEIYCEASPVFHVTPDDPPFFIYHGTRDIIVPPVHAMELNAVLNHAGVKHELLWVNKRGHLSTFFFAGDAVRNAIDFLDRTLK